jgi:hypothetical protein
MIRYLTEADLCTAMISRATDCGFVAFPEVGRWDFVLAYDGEDDTGIQTIGVQAKLTQSWKVLSQAVRQPTRAPNFRGVLVPRASKEFRALARQLRLLVFDGQGLWRRVDEPAEKWRWNHASMRLPVVAGVGTAGSPSPERLTPWRERAVVLCHLLRTRGWISGHDFAGLGVNRTTWLREGWVRIISSGWDVRDGRRARRYVACGDLPDERYATDVRSKVFNAWATSMPWLRHDT